MFQVGINYCIAGFCLSDLGFFCHRLSLPCSASLCHTTLGLLLYSAITVFVWLINLKLFFIIICFCDFFLFNFGYCKKCGYCDSLKHYNDSLKHYNDSLKHYKQYTKGNKITSFAFFLHRAKTI